VLVVARLDRLTRAIRLHQQLLNLFKENNVRFVSIAEGLDSKTKSGKKVLEAINILALWDAKSIPDRTKQMIERKRKIGEHVGHAPFGFTYQKKRLTPLEKELAIASIIREKREDENLSYHKIAKFLNSQRLRAKRGGRWYAETIKVICENPLYERDSKAKNESLSR
jgi:DNA invertase Pin-like site-specific DNA recombinase